MLYRGLVAVLIQVSQVCLSWGVFEVLLLAMVLLCKPIMQEAGLKVLVRKGLCSREGFVLLWAKWTTLGG